jgi:hypothetical protein
MSSSKEKYLHRFGEDRREIGDIQVDPSPNEEPFQGLPLESLVDHNVIDTAIQVEHERIERTKKRIEKERE